MRPVLTPASGSSLVTLCVFAVIRTKRVVQLIILTACVNVVPSLARSTQVFNRGFGPSFFTRLLNAFAREVLMLATRDSVFFDSPLSNTGISQVKLTPHQLKSSRLSRRAIVLRGICARQSLNLKTSVGRVFPSEALVTRAGW